MYKGLGFGVCPVSPNEGCDFGGYNNKDFGRVCVRVS